MSVSIVVHGGAGNWTTSKSRYERAVLDCESAARAGQLVLLGGGLALDAVEEAVRCLEDSPVLDAGTGSHLNADGNIEMDAIIMDGRTLDLGAIAAIERIRNPISLARLVLTKNSHNFLVSTGADAFADAIGFPRCQLSDLIVDGQLEEYKAWKSNEGQPSGSFAAASPDGGTVGAVAFDQWSNLAAATSTGGTKRKQPGRVGDSPLVGSGAYADNWSAAASATGHGESLMKILISKRVCDFVSIGFSAQKACEVAIDLLRERVGGSGGIIAIDRHGQVGVAFNTSQMPFAYAIGDDAPVVDTIED